MSRFSAPRILALQVADVLARRQRGHGLFPAGFQNGSTLFSRSGFGHNNLKVKEASTSNKPFYPLHAPPLSPIPSSLQYHVLQIRPPKQGLRGLTCDGGRLTGAGNGDRSSAGATQLA